MSTYCVELIRDGGFRIARALGNQPISSVIQHNCGPRDFNGSCDYGTWIYCSLGLDKDVARRCCDLCRTPVPLEMLGFLDLIQWEP